MKKLGATGKFPEGHLNPDDEGELSLAVAYDPRKNVVMIQFGKPVKWFAMNPEQAIEFANTIIQNARRG